MKAGTAALALLCGACAAPKSGAPVLSAPAIPDANFAVSVREVVERAEDDAAGWLRVFIDGSPAGQTPAGPRSREKLWEARLPEGNRLMRFEYWVSTGVEAGVEAGAAPLSEDYQPRERFIRIEPGARTSVRLKFYDKGRRSETALSRQPLPPSQGGKD